MEPTYEEMTSLGVITWLSSEEDGGPDCGATLGLGGGYLLQIGEISNDTWSDAGGDDMGLGKPNGKWIILFGPSSKVVLGRAPDGSDADEILSAVADAVGRE